MKKLMLSLVLGVFFYSCIEHGEDVNPPISDTPGEIVNWRKIDSFNESLFNSRLFDEKLIIVGRNSLFYNVNLPDIGQGQTFESYLSRPGRYKLPTSSSVFSVRTERSIRIFPIESIDASQSISLNVLDLDPGFMAFEDIPYWQGEAFGASKSGVLLFPYRAMDNNNIAENNPKFFLIDAARAGGGVTIVETKNIVPTNFNWFATVSRIDSFDNLFVVRSGNQTLAIDLNGQIAVINSIPSKAVQLNNEIGVIGTDRGNNEIVIYKNTPGNNNWTISNRGIIEEQLILNGEFTGVDNKIVAYSGNRLFHLAIENNRIRSVELQNFGLENSIISSILKLNNNEILITTICDNNNTNCGAFKKNLDDFFIPKPAE